MDESTSALLLIWFRYLSESLADSAVFAGVTAGSPQNTQRDNRESLAKLMYPLPELRLKYDSTRKVFIDENNTPTKLHGGTKSELLRLLHPNETILDLFEEPVKPKNQISGKEVRNNVRNGLDRFQK